MTYWEDHVSGYYLGVYLHGALAVASLGDRDLVDCALRRYVASHGYGIATQSDLVASLAEVFPDAARQLRRYGIGVRP